MIYVFENPGNNASIIYDEMSLTEEQKLKGIPIEQLPIPEEIEGKVSVLKCRKSTGEVWYEYEDIPQNTEIEELKKQISYLNIAMAQILGV